MTPRAAPGPDDFDALERALATVAAVPPPPPPPFRARIEPALDAARTSRSRRWALVAGVAGLAAAAAWLVVLSHGTPDAARPPFVVRSGAEFVRSQDGVSWIASGPATFVSSTAEISVEAGTSLTLESSGDRVHLYRGRATFHILHPDGSRALSNRRFWLLAGGVTIWDVGTTFGVDVSSPLPYPGAHFAERVVVTVTEGWLEVEPGEERINLSAGRGIAFVNGKATGPAWPLDAKPTLALEAESATPTAGSPVVLRVVLANPTDGWIPWPSSGAAEGPLHVEVTDPSGAVIPVRVTNSMLVGGSAGTAIPPRGQSVLRVRFDRTFASPGTYRLRAIFRPAEAVEVPTSATLTLSVRAPDRPVTPPEPPSPSPAAAPTTGRPR